MIRPSLQDILKVANRKGYKIFDNDKKDYNLNIWAIRSGDDKPLEFNDLRILFWKYMGQWSCAYQNITTDPGLFYRNNLLNKEGVAILKEGQIGGGWKLGLHQGKYEALVQAKPVTVYRDGDRNNYLDFSGLQEETGLFGINHHAAATEGVSVQNQKWSAGCQVAPNWSDHRIFMRLCKEANRLFSSGAFTYTLITEADL